MDLFFDIDNYIADPNIDPWFLTSIYYESKDGSGGSGKIITKDGIECYNIYGPKARIEAISVTWYGQSAIKEAIKRYVDSLIFPQRVIVK